MIIGIKIPRPELLLKPSNYETPIPMIIGSDTNNVPTQYLDRMANIF